MILNLKNIFSKFEKILSLNIFLYNLKFGITIKNLKKNFDKFFIKFILTIILLNFINWHKNKISNF